MRRMATNKQLEFVDKASKAIKINDLEEIIKVPFAYTNLEEIVDYLTNKGEDVDFENHVIVSGAYITYYYAEDCDSEKGYLSFEIDEDISFPETISTLASLAVWLTQNFLLDENAYIEDSDTAMIPELKWYDIGSSEFEFVNNIVYLIGELNYSPETYPVLEIETIPVIKSRQFLGNIGNSGSKGTGMFSDVQTDKLSATSIVKNITVSNNMILDANKYLQAPYLYGQLGSATTHSNAYVNIMYFDGLFGNGNSAINTTNNDLSIYHPTQATLKGGAYDGEPAAEIDISNQGITIDPDYGESGSKYLILVDIPTSDPQVAGAVWNDNGVLKISAGQ